MGIQVVMDVDKDIIIGVGTHEGKIRLIIATKDGVVALSGTERDLQNMLTQLRSTLNDTLKEMSS
jgi:hypothetical protein